MDGRERIAELLDTVVGRVRAVLDRGGLSPDEVASIMSFYVLADHLRAATRDAAQPMHPTALAGGLRQLKAHCAGRLVELCPQVASALEEAENVDWDRRTA